MEGDFGCQPLDVDPPRRRGRNQVATNSRAIRANRSQKPRWVGHGAYCVSAPPSSRAPVKPKAWAPVVTDAARFDCPSALKSTIAAVAVPAVRPTPMPAKARPANSHSTSGATAKRNVRSEEHTSELQSRLHLVC